MIAVNPNHIEIADDDSVFHHYQRLIKLRRNEPAVAHGDFPMLLADHDRIYAFTRRHSNAELLVLTNFSGEPTTIEIPDTDRWQDTELILASVPQPEVLKTRLTLQPWEARVHGRG